MLLGGLFGCSGRAERSDVGSLDEIAGGAPETVELRGRTLMRRDLWSDDEYQRIIFEGRANQPSTSPEVLAAQMRGHTIANGVYYIELQPDVELARQILADPLYDMGTHSQAPREERNVIGTDTRAPATPNNTYPNTTIGFLETGCTGTRIGARTVYTAAHCVYSTITTNGWYCRNGFAASTCTDWPRWRFGVEDGAGFSNWTANGCHWQTIPTAFVNLTDPGGSGGETWWDFARWDYAVVDLRQCSAGNTGWLGTLIVDDATLTDSTFFVRGYPMRATCPTGAKGDLGSPPGSGGTLSDCPGTGSYPGSTYRYNGDTTKPYTGAEIWSSNDSNVAPGTQHATASISSTIDITQGNSGSGLYFLLGTIDRRVVGVASNASSSVSRFNRFTVGVYNFMVAYSDFPDDTQ